MLFFKSNQPLAQWIRALAAIILVVLSLSGTPAGAQSGLPTLGDAGDLTVGDERRLGDRIIRELYRDPDYIDDAVLDEYVNNLWQSLLAAARARGGLSPRLGGRFAWGRLLGRGPPAGPRGCGVRWRRSWRPRPDCAPLGVRRRRPR